jgi:hypothetical protein
MERQGLRQSRRIDDGIPARVRREGLDPGRILRNILPYSAEMLKWIS